MNQLHDFKTLLLHYYTWKLYVKVFINMFLKFSEDLKSVLFWLSFRYFSNLMRIISSFRQATVVLFCTQKQPHRGNLVGFVEVDQTIVCIPEQRSWSIGQADWDPSVLKFRLKSGNDLFGSRNTLLKTYFKSITSRQRS